MLITTKLNIGCSSELLLQNVSVSIDSAKKIKVALVGQNGSGKTTFLKTLASILDPEGGTISAMGERISYLSQHSIFPKNKLVGEILEEEISDVWEYYRIEIVLNEVGLKEEFILREADTLSGGEKLRLQLAKILLSDPTILLLDEPSNHLDEEGITWLRSFINRFSGSVILVSHDRGLINSTVNQIWEIDCFTKELNVYNGNYDFWRAEKKRISLQKEERFNQINGKVKEIIAWLKNNEFSSKFRFSTIVIQQKRKLEKLQEELDFYRIARDPVTVLKIKDPNSNKKPMVLKYEVSVPSLFKKKIGKIYQGDRVQVCGLNGSGKTTFLRILAGEITDFEGTVFVKEGIKIAWLRQHCSLNMNMKVGDIIRKELVLSDTEFFNLLACFRLKSLKDALISTLSGGEQKRVEMAILLFSKPDILFLDEPTNHLDLYVQDELQDFLINVKQTIVFITHDTYLAEGLVSTSIVDMSA